MNFSRRGAILGCISLIGSPPLWKVRSAFAREFLELEVLPPIPAEFASIADEAPMNEEFTDSITMLGTGAPTEHQRAVAKEIIESLVFDNAPIDIAGQLLDIAKGEREEWRGYTRAWPKDAPANPLIVEFFKATDTKPEGDTTAWCAASLNWFILKSHEGRAGGSNMLKPTKSASSGSFRTWGTQAVKFDPNSPLEGTVVQDPQVGDIVVFNQTNADGSPHLYKGHVAFFLDMDKNRIRVLGGNQYEGNPVVHAINVKWIPKDGFLKAHSIRTDKSLHS